MLVVYPHWHCPYTLAGANGRHFMSIVLSSNVLCCTFLYMYIYNLYSRTYVGNIDPLKVQRWMMARYQFWSFWDTWWALYVILRFHVFHWNVIMLGRIKYVIGWESSYNSCCWLNLLCSNLIFCYVCMAISTPMSYVKRLIRLS